MARFVFLFTLAVLAASLLGAADGDYVVWGT